MSQDSRKDERSNLITCLWELKSAMEESGDTKFVHYNMMLRDDNYRKELIEKGVSSTNESVVKLAKQVEQINLPGSLIGEDARENYAGPDADSAQLRQAANSAPSPVPERQVEPQRESDNRPGMKAGFSAGIAAVVLLIAAGIVFATYFQPKLSKEQLVNGSIYGQTIWSADKSWILEGLVFVESGAQLTIEPGTQILAKPGAALIVTRDATIDARGAADNPILFSSAKEPGLRSPGDWGGVVLLGNAPINTRVEHIEGISKDDPRGGFGGSDTFSNCGVMQYVRIEFAGHEISANNELNGLTLGGCGESTIIRFVQIHKALDDGLELFGGTVNIRNILVTQPGDDGLDWDRGWQGNGQFIVVQMGSRSGDNAIEADNYGKDHHSEPRSKPFLSNVTLVGSLDSTKSQRGMVLRRGTAGDFRNMAIFGFTSEAIDIRDSATVAQIESGELSFKGLMIDDNSSRFNDEGGENDDDGGFSETEFFASIVQRGQIGDMDDLPTDIYSLTKPKFTPLNKRNVTKYAVAITQGEFWDEAANYLGAMRPENYNSWIDGWAAYPDR
ncbi:hypothetical protein D5085_15415 [Ectothiorhodospiraceae bacterium BW-2]|nr:hypothetical protein D5085_15415 [Ectothiorhodospiraceae bacterium BW-2]